MYHRHCVVLTQNKLWSTVQADKPLNLLDLLNICSVRLIYLDNLCFGVLTWRPRLPKKRATRSPGLNLIEEYTLDETNYTADALKSQNVYPGNVETPLLRCEATTSTDVKAETAMLPKDVTKDLPKVDTHQAPSGNSRTSSPLQGAETGSDRKPEVCAQTSSIEKNNIGPKLSTMQLQSALHVETRSDKLTTTLDSGHSDGTA